MTLFRGGILVALALATIFTCLVGPAVSAQTTDWAFVEKRLRQAGFKKNFVEQLQKNYQTENFLEVLELNTLLFLKKSDYHGVQVTPEAVTEVRAFMDTHLLAFNAAEQKYRVSPSVIASLLWLESRHGKNIGQFHVPSVFIHLLQADRPYAVQHLHNAAKKFTDRVTSKNRQDINLRTKRRVKWALAELKAVQKMYARNGGTLSPFSGSFAGAFGMAQFLPSSYVDFARSSDANRPPDLARADDAILSVAFYLRESGWRPKRPKTFVRALLRYNQSQDYAHAILNLAQQASPNTQQSLLLAVPSRTPATKKSKRKTHQRPH